MLCDLENNLITIAERLAGSESRKEHTHILLCAHAILREKNIPHNLPSEAKFGTLTWEEQWSIVQAGFGPDLHDAPLTLSRLDYNAPSLPCMNAFVDILVRLAWRFLELKMTSEAEDVAMRVANLALEIGRKSPQHIQLDVCAFLREFTATRIGSQGTFRVRIAEAAVTVARGMWDHSRLRDELILPGSQLNLAECLHLLGLSLLSTGRPEGAIHALSEAIAIQREHLHYTAPSPGLLVHSDLMHFYGLMRPNVSYPYFHPTDSYTPPFPAMRLAEFLLDYGVALRDAERHNAAAQIALAEGLFLFRQSTGGFRAEHWRGLVEYGTYLQRIGNYADSVVLLGIVVEGLDRLGAVSGPHLVARANAQDTYGVALRGYKKYSQACQAGARAVFWGRKAVKEEAGSKHDLARYLHNYGVSLRHNGDVLGAYNAGKEAVQLKRPYVRDAATTRVMPQLALYLLELSKSISAYTPSHLEEARDFASEAVDLVKRAHVRPLWSNLNLTLALDNLEVILEHLKDVADIRKVQSEKSSANREQLLPYLLFP